jgi:hypothetical protein
MYGGMGIYQNRKGRLWKSRSRERLTSKGKASKHGNPRMHIGYKKPDWNKNTMTDSYKKSRGIKHKQKYRNEYGRIEEYEDLQKLAEVEEELNLIREEPEFRNMSVEEYKEILDCERDMIRNLNLWDMDYLDSEQLFRMKKLTSHFNYILEMRRQMREA